MQITPISIFSFICSLQETLKRRNEEEYIVKDGNALVTSTFISIYKSLEIKIPQPKLKIASLIQT